MPSKRTPPDRDPQLREALALPESDQLAQLRAMNGDAPVAADQQLVPVAKPAKPTKRPRKKSGYVHPEKCPDVSEMLDELASGEAQTYGRRHWGRFTYGLAIDVAARAETEIYNAWVVLQCLKGNCSNRASCRRAHSQHGTGAVATKRMTTMPGKRAPCQAHRAACSPAMEARWVAERHYAPTLGRPKRERAGVGA